VRRVIIDIDIRTAVTIYVERYADDRTLAILPVLGKTEITSVPRPLEEQEVSADAASGTGI